MTDPTAPYDLAKGAAPDLQTIFTENCRLRENLDNTFNVLDGRALVDRHCEEAKPPVDATLPQLKEENKELNNVRKMLLPALGVSRG